MQIKLLAHKSIDYPSGSALEFYEGFLYLIGDDINYILMLDKNWNEVDRKLLFEFDGERIPKPKKPDLECAAMIGSKLYAFGSGSVSPQRDVVFVVDVLQNKVDKIDATPFYSTIRESGLLAEMNIEGFTDCKNKLLFFNRANTQQPNQLIITDKDVLKNKIPFLFKIIPIEIGFLNDISLGISGACYDEKNDILFLTSSAENTSNTYDDGEIIGSTLSIIYDAYKKLEDDKLVIDEVIELEKTDALFSKQKIESICMINRIDNNYTFNLVADNDDGKSVLFEITIEL